MFAYFDKETAALIYAWFIPNTPRDNHLAAPTLTAKLSMCARIFCVTDAVAMLPGSNATVLYGNWLIVAISLLAHCC